MTERSKRPRWISEPANGAPSGESRSRSSPPPWRPRAFSRWSCSFDDYVITSLVAGVDSETLPMVIYAMARRGVSPVVNAVSALIVVAFGIVIVISQRLQASDTVRHESASVSCPFITLPRPARAIAGRD